MATGVTDQTLTFELTNESNEPLSLHPLDQAGGDNGYHFRLSFRPGTLTNVEKVSIAGLQEGEQWSLVPAGGITGRQVFQVQ